MNFETHRTAETEPAQVGTAPPAPVKQCERLGDVLAMATQVFDTALALVSSGADMQAAVVAQVGDHPAARHLDHPAILRHDDHRPVLILPEQEQTHRGAPGAPVAWYAGVALLGTDGARLGTLAVWDVVTRDPPSTEQLTTLTRLGRLASGILEQQECLRQAMIDAQISDKAFDGVLIADRHGRVRSCNRAAATLFGQMPLVGQPLAHLFPLRLQSDAQRTSAWLEGAGEDGHHLRILAPDGSPRLLDATRCAWRSDRDQGTTLFLHDVTEACTQRAQLDRLAHFDPLTGLPNRNALLGTLAAHQEARDWGVALIAIDRFKWVNDSLGHAVGDRVLQLIAGRLQAEIAQGMCLSRVGGDEFALACSDIHLQPVHSDAPGSLVQRMVQRIAQPLHVHGHEIQVEASVGIALGADVNEGGDLLACADLALYRAKSGGGHQERRYHPAMRTDALARRELDLELRRAFCQGEFEVHYQPQVDLTSGRTCGAEALLRWRHPRRGMVPAGEFIDALTRSSLGLDVGVWALRRACADAMQWPRAMPVSVNLFPAQVGEHLVAQVEEALALSGLPAHRLELEITETIAFAHDGAGAAALSQLRARGIRLAFDDFGTGYASLAMLQRFEIDRVKIDRSFVGEMLNNAGDAEIVRWIVMLARNLGLRVVAEGVENGIQASRLLDLGCDEAQGYLYAPALPHRSMLERMRSPEESDHG